VPARPSALVTAIRGVAPRAFAIALAAHAAACSRHEIDAGAHGPSPRAAAKGAGAPAFASPEAARSGARADGGVGDASAAEPARAAPPKDLDVVLITIDCLRADMPWAGYARPIAPRLTAFAEHAVDYTRAYSVSSYTSMSLGGLLAGKTPGQLSRDGYFFGTYGKDNVFFPEVLQREGVGTLGAAAHGYFKTAKFDQGFDAWEVVPGLKWSNTTDENVTSPELEKIAERLLGDPALDTKRFFAWFHFLDPHDQYVAHEGIGPYGKTARDRYDAEVTFTDRYVGQLFDFIAARPWGKRTAIVVTADHGEAFGDHGRYLHGFELWESLVRVPLLVQAPGAAPRKIDARRSAVDLAPTIVELMGVRPAPSFDGKSLVPEIYGAPAEERDVVLDLPATSDNDKRRALIHGKYKLIASNTKPTYIQVFDLDADPDEKAPLPPRSPEAEEMRARFKDVERALRDIPAYQCKENCLNGAYARKDGGS